MPIRKFIDGDAFDPETIQELNAALLGACRALGLKLKDDETSRLLAMRIIELAREGEHNPERLRSAALKDFSHRSPGRQDCT